jgi:phenylpyruvate tautomerase PptA (4-oxalocrotonate tautomerase family)
MPFYEVAHATPLTSEQRDALAEAITSIHSNKFTVPRMYINVIYTDTSSTPTYVGGRPVRPECQCIVTTSPSCQTNASRKTPPKTTSNRIVARVRRGSSRSREDFNALCSEIQAAWARIIHPGLCENDELPPRDLELRAIFITGELLAGLKCGFHVPTAGDELAWATENYTAFQKRADAGDEDFIDLVAEVKQWPGFIAPTQP